MKSLPKPFFVLAPMDDVTDTVLRQIVADCSAPDLFFTEFVNVDGLQSPGRPRLLHKLQFTVQEQPLIAQIWGKNPDNYYKTAKEIVEMGFSGIDINMGCPDKLVVKNGCCSALINNRQLAAEIIKATKEGAGDLPVSVKLRTGFNEVDYSWHEYILGQGIKMLSIHGRTTKQMSKVPNNWDDIGHIREIRDKIDPNTLIVGNGDVLTRKEGELLAKKYKLDGIMIGRGIFTDPYIFAKDSQWLATPQIDRLLLYKKHALLFNKTYPEGQKNWQSLKRMAKMYIHGIENASKFRDKLMHSSSLDDMLGILDSQIDYNEAKQT